MTQGIDPQRESLERIVGALMHGYAGWESTIDQILALFAHLRGVRGTEEDRRKAITSKACLSPERRTADRRKGTDWKARYDELLALVNVFYPAALDGSHRHFKKDCPVCKALRQFEALPKSEAATRSVSIRVRFPDGEVRTAHEKFIFEDGTEVTIERECGAMPKSEAGKKEKELYD